MKLPTRPRSRSHSAGGAWTGPAALRVPLAAGLAMLIAGCAVEAPKAPSTDFVISIPVANDSTRIETLVEDRDDFLRIDPGTRAMTLRVAVPLGSGGDQPPPAGCEDGRDVLGCQEVGDNLQVPSVSDEFGTELGTITFDDPQELPPVELNLNDLFDTGGGEVSAGDTLAFFPEAPLDTPPIALALPNIESLTVLSGGIEVTVDNGFPVAIENFVLTLIDRGNGDVLIDELDLGTIPAGTAAGGAFSLAGSNAGPRGNRISAELDLVITGNTAGGTNIPVTEEPIITFATDLLPLQVTEARALIPSQEFSDSQVLLFEEDAPVRVREAVIRSGKVTLNVRNEIPVIMALSLTLPDVRDASDQPLTLAIDRLDTAESVSREFDLSNTAFRTDLDKQQMRIEYSASTFESPTVVTITDTGQIVVGAEMENLIFDRVEGVLDSVRLDIPPEEQEVEFPDGLDNVNIGSASVAAYMTTAVGFSAFIDLLFEGTNARGDTETLRIEQAFAKGSFENPQTAVVTVDTGLTRFLNNLPTTIRVTPVVKVGDGVETQSVERNHWVSVDSVVIRSAPRVTVLADTRIDPDVEDISFRDSELRDKIATNFRDAFVITELESSIPVGVGVRLMVARTREAVYDTASADFVRAIPRRDRGRFEVPAAPVDANGVSNGTSTNTVEIELDRDDVLDLILEDAVPGRPPDSLFSGVRVTLPATSGEVEVRADDFVTIIAAMRLRLLLNDDLLK